MNPSFTQRLQDVRKHYQEGDEDLGYRRLLDAALETGNPEIYREALAYSERIEQADNSQIAFDKRQEVDQLMEQIERVGPTTQAQSTEPLLTVTDLGKTYSKGGFTLRNVSMTLQPGEITGLVGQNGHGKTTLLRLLAAGLEPDMGTIEYHLGTRLPDDYALRSHLIYIEQRIPKWYGSLMDNLYFVQAHYGLRNEEAALRAELVVARLGLRPYKHLTWATISSGYRTRFEIAKALLRQPRILLLDEPLANLDIVAQQTLLQDLKFMAASISAPFGMLLSSQHIYEVEKVSDSIMFLDKGLPRYQKMQDDGFDVNLSLPDPLVIEMETTANKETLRAAFSAAPLLSLNYNGGVYIFEFEPGTTPAVVWNVIATSGIEVGYVRNITKSTRRFFNNKKN